MESAHGEPHAVSDQASISRVIGFVPYWSDRCCHDERRLSTQTAEKGFLLVLSYCTAAIERQTVLAPDTPRASPTPPSRCGPTSWPAHRLPFCDLSAPAPRGPNS